MGGQACVLYGGAEFSRDTDLAICASEENLARLREALQELQAETIAIPPLELDYLQRGHGVHFRCQHPEALGMRVDVMAVMRGVADFERLWARRTTIEVGAGATIEVMSLPDLVRAKKTQRDKDWGMLRRLVEASYVSGRAAPNPSQLRFWFAELRTAQFLVELCAQEPQLAADHAEQRPAVSAACRGDVVEVETEIAAEERAERELDRRYWAALRSELEQIRKGRRRIDS